jgi:hypothetical protein
MNSSAIKNVFNYMVLFFLDLGFLMNMFIKITCRILLIVMLISIVIGFYNGANSIASG